MLMVYNIQYTYTPEEINDEITRSVSSVAARSLDNTGNSMFDALRILSRDADEVAQHVASSFGYLRTRLVDVCKTEEFGGGWKVNLSLPDFSGDEEVLRKDILSFVSQETTALWLETRHGEVAKIMNERAQEELTSIARRVKTRARPERNG